MSSTPVASPSTAASHLPTPDMPPAPFCPPGHVILLLHWIVNKENIKTWWHLKLPLDILERNCKPPVLFLKLFAVYIPSIATCDIVYHATGIGCPPDLDLVEGSIFRVVDNPTDGHSTWPPVALDSSTNLPDMDAINRRSSMHTSAESEARSKPFVDAIQRRDTECIFTGVPAMGCQVQHIVRFHFGERIQELVARTLPEPLDHDEDGNNIASINDPRNGALVNTLFHTLFDDHFLTIMPTPNRVITTDNIPWRERDLSTQYPDMEYPAEQQFAAQWVLPGAELNRYVMSTSIQNNTKAAFARVPPGSNVDPVPLPSMRLCIVHLVCVYLEKFGYGNPSISYPYPEYHPPEDGTFDPSPASQDGPGTGPGYGGPMTRSRARPGTVLPGPTNPHYGANQLSSSAEDGPGLEPFYNILLAVSGAARRHKAEVLGRICHWQQEVASVEGVEAV